MKLKKMLIGLALAGTVVFGSQAAFACLATTYEPYDCSWILQDGSEFGVSIYGPVSDGVMFIAGTGGTSIALAIDTKTYPVFQPIYILSEAANYFASEDEMLGQEDVLLGSKPIVDLSFTVDGVDTKYTYYDGSGYTGLKLLNEDNTYSGTLVKVTNLEPFCSVPVPGAVWLLGTGLVGLAGLRKRKK